MKKLKILTFLLLFIIPFFQSCKNEDPISSFTDPRDGEIYKIVKIGRDYWFAENLRYAGNIPQITGYIDWGSTSQPAWCYYTNDPFFNMNYGKLYNWYAVSTGNICPSGWHVPSKEEWQKLSDYLGGNDESGGKLKSTASDWEEPNFGATNSSQFSGLPGGNRFYNGIYDGYGSYGIWWSSTGNLSLNMTHSAFGRSIYHSSATNNEPLLSKSYGLSCRCIKD